MKKNLFYSLIILIITFVFSSCDSDTGSYTSKTQGIKIENLSDGFPQLPGTMTGTIYNHKKYSCFYNDELVGSYWVSYILTADMVKSQNIDRSGETFIADPLLDEHPHAVNSDYTKSGYDRGHLCPNGDMNYNKEFMDETYFLSNVLPQIPNFNRGIWEKLEEKVRDWAVQNDSIYVIVGALFNQNPKRIGKDKVAVPSKFYKVVFDITKKGGYKMIAFLFDNKEYNNNNYYQNALSISDLEQITGIKFFPNYSDSQIATLKSTLRIQEWEQEVAQ